MAVSEEVIGGEQASALVSIGWPKRVLFESALLRFVVVGGASYLVNQALLYSCYETVFGSMRPRRLIGLDEALLFASILAVEASIVFRFVLNDRWTFKGMCGDKPLYQRLLESNVSSLGAPLIALSCVNLLTPLLGVSFLITNSLGIALGLCWNWQWSRHVVWRPAAIQGQ